MRTIGVRWRPIGMVICALLAGCAPAVDGPVERQRLADRADGDRLAVQLTALPGAITAHVTLHRPIRDPLGAASSPGSAAILVVIDDRADETAVTRAATALTHASAPEIGNPMIVVTVGALRPVLASVGPFTVEASSQRPLRAALGGAFVVIAALAGWIALRERQRRGNRPQ